MDVIELLRRLIERGHPKPGRDEKPEAVPKRPSRPAPTTEDTTAADGDAVVVTGDEPTERAERRNGADEAVDIVGLQHWETRRWRRS